MHAFAGGRRSNLRPTTRELVHFVSRGHFRSRDNSMRHSHKPHDTLQLRGSLLNRNYCRSKLYIAGMGIFDLFAPVTLTLTRWPYTNLTRIPWRYTGCDKLQIWTSCIKAFESYRLIDRQKYRQTDRQTRPKLYTPRRFAGGQKQKKGHEHRAEKDIGPTWARSCNAGGRRTIADWLIDWVRLNVPPNTL